MPSTQLRQSVLRQVRRVVVKLGTQLLTGNQGRLDLDYLADVAAQIATLRQRGYEVTVVSSGAVGAGLDELNLTQRPKDVAELQAVAAVGQRRLMTHFHEAFAPHGLKVGQLLLTRSDFDERSRFLNIRNCITHLHNIDCIPIINENDTVAVDELCVGDNDMLAALVTNALHAEALILLTVVDGLLDREGKTVDLVNDVNEVAGMARKDKSTLGTGGMHSKLSAAQHVTDAGELCVIANGRSTNVLINIAEGSRVGTVFAPAPRRLVARKRWIGLAKRPAVTLTIDPGAAHALRKRGSSLLATGVTGVQGNFEPGAVVVVNDQEGVEIARGLINYSADDTRKIMGRRSTQFEQILGHCAYPEVIHRDNMVVTQASS